MDDEVRGSPASSLLFAIVSLLTNYRLRLTELVWTVFIESFISALLELVDISHLRLLPREIELEVLWNVYRTRRCPWRSDNFHIVRVSRPRVRISGDGHS